MAELQTFSIISLGCPKNTVDSEVLKGHLERLRLQFEPNPAHADLIFINTCGFIEAAREESVDTILETLELKKVDPAKRVIATGCLSQRYPDQMRAEIPELDGIFGVESAAEIVRTISNTCESCEDVERIRSLLTPAYTAYLKIAEGCDNSCSFCSIPLMRGKQHSRAIDSLLREAAYLHEKGVRELILIAQDLTRYGSDLHPRVDLYTLLDELLGARLFPWVRLLYAHPDFWKKELNTLFQKYTELCPYLDIPVQHASSRILKLMERGNDPSQIKATLMQLRRDVPTIALRTSVMVGFPTESMADFNELLDFIEELRFERLGVFTYSPEEDTRAMRLPDDVSGAEKESRKDIVMQLQWDIAREFAMSKVGQTIEVLIESEHEDGYMARSRWDAPEIDGIVKVSSEQPLETGGIYPVNITDVDGIDLIGQIPSEPEA